MWKKIKNHFKRLKNLYIFILSVSLAIGLGVWLFFVTDFLKDFLLKLEWFVKNNPFYAYLIAFVAAIVEGTIFLGALPGTTYVVTAGVFASTPRGELLKIEILFPLVILGSVLGDLFGYFLGRYFSGVFFKYFGDTEYYLMTKKFVEKFKGKAVFYGRFVSGIKEFVPFVVGIMKMSFKTFIFWNFLGAVGWSTIYLMIGYIAGQYVTNVDNIVKAVGTSFLIFFMITAWNYYKKNKEEILSWGKRKKQSDA